MSQVAIKAQGGNKQFDAKTSVVESFAKDLIENIMLHAVQDVLNKKFEAMMSWKKVVDVYEKHDTLKHANSANVILEKKNSLLELAPETQQVFGNSNVPIGDKSPTKQEINSLVLDLCNIKIGDSSLASSMNRYSLKEDMKIAVEAIQFASESLASPEIVIVDGQGDVNNYIVQESLNENESAVASMPQEQSAIEELNTRKEGIEELKKIIEEMENDVSNEGDVSNFKKIIPDTAVEILDFVTGDVEIATWEEKKERFVRVIEGPSSDDNEAEEDPIPELTVGEMVFVGAPSKLSISASSNVSSSRIDYVEEIIIEEVGTFPLFPDTEAPQTLPPPPQILPLPPISGHNSAGDLLTSDLEGEFKNKSSTLERSKKKSLGSKLRKLFSTVFGRNKRS